jgi:hypothetical protein
MTQQTQQATAIAAAVSSNIPNAPPQPTLYTVEQFPTVEPSFTPAALRNLIFKAQPRHSTVGVIPGNGLIECGAIVRVGRKVLIHRAKFLEWVQQ